VTGADFSRAESRAAPNPISGSRRRSQRVQVGRRQNARESRVTNTTVVERLSRTQNAHICRDDARSLVRRMALSEFYFCGSSVGVGGLRRASGGKPASTHAWKSARHSLRLS
jgi:hypothetical protein